MSHRKIVVALGGNAILTSDPSSQSPKSCPGTDCEAPCQTDQKRE